MKKLIFTLITVSVILPTYGMIKQISSLEANMLKEGLEFVRRGQPQEALRAFQVASQSDNPEIKYQALYSAATLFLQLNNRREAENILLKIAEKSPNSDMRARAYIELGKLYSNTEDYGSYYLEQVTLGKYHPVWQAEALLLLGLNALQFDFYKAAEDYFKRAAEQDANLAVRIKALHELIKLYTKQKRYQDARYFLNRALQSNIPALQAEAKSLLKNLEASEAMHEFSMKPRFYDGGSTESMDTSSE